MASERKAATAMREREEHGGPLPPWEQALAVCLGRGSADVRSVCMLLATAKRLRALVHEHCRPGSLLVCFKMHTLARGRGFAAWLSQHGSLLGDLELDLWLSWNEQKAPGMQDPPDDILAQLPGSLTRLVVRHFGSDNENSIVRTARAANLARALAVQPMQQLRELQVLDRGVDAAYDQVVCNALAGSSQLTSIVVSTASNTAAAAAAAVMRCLDTPLAAQLQQLVVDSEMGADLCPPLAVAHLARLTRLVMPAPLGSFSASLPSSIVSLGVAASADAAPQLLALTQLTQLQLQHAERMPAAQLRSLSGLRQLQHLELDASDHNSRALYVAEAASSFNVLPLKHLEARLSAAQQLTAPALADVGRCTGLTRLLLAFYTLAPGACVEQLAAALAQLTALRRLHLTLPSHLGAVAISAGAAEALALAVGGLQHLTDCGLGGYALGPTVVHLTSLSALTSLFLADSGLDDAGLTAVCAALPGLQSLDLFGNNQLTDASLAAIASTQRHLTKLCLPARSPGRISSCGLRLLAEALPCLDVLTENDDAFDDDFDSEYDTDSDGF